MYGRISGPRRGTYLPAPPKRVARPNPRVALRAASLAAAVAQNGYFGSNVAPAQ